MPPPVHHALATCAIPALVLLASGCKKTEAASLPDNAPAPIEVAAVARSFSEAQTAGPLNRPLSLVVSEKGVWVLDSGNQRVLLLRDGEPTVVMGREGAGPGEFKNPLDLHLLSPDRVFVWDNALLRRTELPADGGEADTKLVSSTLQGLGIRHALPSVDGMLAVFDKSVDALNPPSGTQGSQGVVARIRDDSSRVDTLATFPLSGPVVIRETGPGGGLTMSAYTAPFDAPPHADATSACGGVSAVSVGGRKFEIHLFGLEGSRLGVLREPILGGKITEEERARYFAQFGDDARQRHRLERLISIPERHPAVNAVRLASSGHLWVRLTPSVDSPEQEATWRVWPIERLKPEILLSEPTDVRLPGRFSFQDLRDGEAWGFEYDEFDVPHVRSYRLAWQPGPTCQGL